MQRHRRNWSVRAKALAADRRAAFVGSVNLTGKGAWSGELRFRMQGAPAAGILEFLESERANGGKLP